MAENTARQPSPLPTSITRLSLLFLSVLVFCVTTVDSPKSTLLVANAALKVPYFDSEVRVSSFLLLGPIAMIGVVIYLHVLIKRYDQLPPDEWRPDQYVLKFIGALLIFLPLTLVSNEAATKCDIIELVKDGESR